MFDVFSKYPLFDKNLTLNIKTLFLSFIYSLLTGERRNLLFKFPTIFLWLYCLRNLCWTPNTIKQTLNIKEIINDE